MLHPEPGQPQAAPETVIPPFAERHPVAVRRARIAAAVGIFGVIGLDIISASRTLAPEWHASPNTNLARKVGRAYLRGQPLPAYQTYDMATPVHSNPVTLRVQLARIISANPDAGDHNVRNAEIICGAALANDAAAPEARLDYARSQDPQVEPGERYASARRAGQTCFDSLLADMQHDGPEPLRVIAVPIERS